MPLIIPVKGVLPIFGLNCYIAPNATITGDVVMGDDCQFNNCMHLNEPGCAVKSGVNDGSVSIDRYVSYCNILDSIEEKNW